MGPNGRYRQTDQNVPSGWRNADQLHYSTYTRLRLSYDQLTEQQTIHSVHQSIKNSPLWIGFVHTGWVFGWSCQL